ncbi:glycosyl transferase family 1 [Natrinema saccharevitans]|uniref:Glycosyl transferase family 1 n=1 Tax=Natrinema saccharevitans TaxID=301967 RepID=A0A1S8AUD4_9EURY|nr:glycosyltransferase family 4 protein [Natrinema saccharevitans]OLZ40423.1 glycosyl transferase family 1 [Natrinema saccharevitans]
MSRSGASSRPERPGAASGSESAATAAASGEPADGTPAVDDRRVLVVTGLAHKNERHYGPLADVAGETTMVCLDPTGGVESARTVRVPEVGPRIVRVFLLFVLALYEGYRNDYDAVASISLVPYGCYALALKAIYGYPAHLGIIGIDLDHHAEQWYGPVPRWLFRRFDAVSVPGTAHAERLVRFGVPPDRIERLTNAIEVDTYRPPERAVETDYEFVWVGRFSAEKDPLRFVDALAELEAADREFRAVMVGDGPLRSAVVDELAARGLSDRVDCPGWVDEPLEYYHRSETFVLTSERDALPLVMLEAMATGLPAIVPPVGSIPDVVTDGENGLVVSDREPATVAAAMERCLDDPDFRRSLGAAATAVRSDVSLERASEDWRRILATLER